MAGDRGRVSLFDGVGVGSTLGHGRYKLTELIGSGSMGDVYKAVQVNLHRTIAIKILRSNLVAGTAEERFRREAVALSRLRHKNTVQVLDFGRERGVSFIAMEYLDGPTLDELVDSRGRLPLPELVEIMSQICGGLGAAHEQGILHRDIKPENIALVKGETDEGEPCTVVKVCDFGISKLMQKSDSGTEWSSVPSLTGAHEVWGTPAFMSPEQAEGGKIDARSDVYACGVLLFLLATGKEPFVGPSPVSILMQQANKPPPRPSEIVEDIDPRLEEIILKALEKSPSDRFADMRELRLELRSVVGLGDAPSQLLGLDLLKAQAESEDGDEISALDSGIHLPPPDELVGSRDTGSFDEMAPAGTSPSGDFKLATAPTITGEDLHDSAEVDESDAIGTGPQEPPEDPDTLRFPHRLASPGVEPSHPDGPAARGAPHGRATRIWAAIALVLAIALAVFVYTSYESAEPTARKYAVESEPPGASVFIDGVFIGETPCEFELATDASAEVRVELGDRPPCVQNISASAPAGTVRCELEAVDEPGSMIVSSEPRGASVWLNGSNTGQVTPAVLAGLNSTGSYHLELVLPGYEPVFYDFMVGASEVARTNFELAPTTLAYLAAECPLTTCTVMLNGLEIGETPMHQLELPAGEPVHVEVRHDGKTLATVDATPRAGEVVRIMGRD